MARQRATAGPARPLGRHHLRPADATALVAAAGIRAGDLVVDLGAGDGAITAPLVAAGASVVAVELDRRALKRLHDRFDGIAAVTIVGGDLLRVPWPRRPFRVVANLPFAVTSAALRRLLDPRGSLRRADLVIQRGAAVAWATELRRCTPAAQRAFELRLGPTIRAHRFVPPPRVDAAVLIVRRR